MDIYFIFGIIIFIVMILLLCGNYKIILLQTEKFSNKFTNDRNCNCSQKNIEECNTYGKSCVCDYFQKNSHFCQDAY